MLRVFKMAETSAFLEDLGLRQERPDWDGWGGGEEKGKGMSRTDVPQMRPRREHLVQRDL